MTQASSSEIQAVLSDLRRRAEHVPSLEECERYRKSHSEIYRGQHHYILKINRRDFGETTYDLSSRSISGSNIIEIMENSLRDGTYISLKEVPIKEYVEAGGSDIPSCLRNCEYEGEWPPCMATSKDD